MRIFDTNVMNIYFKKSLLRKKVKNQIPFYKLKNQIIDQNKLLFKYKKMQIDHLILWIYMLKMNNQRKLIDQNNKIY